MSARVVTIPTTEPAINTQEHTETASEPSSQPVTTLRQRRIAIALLLVGAVCAGIGQTVVFSVLPPLARDLGLSNFQVGSIFMISATAWVLLGPRWGKQSDARGRKPFILTGLLGLAFSMALFASSIQFGIAGALSGLPLYLLMIATRSLYGIIGSAGPPAAQAYIADRTSRTDRTAGIAGFTAAFGFGAMLGPGFGAITILIGPTAPFFAVAILAAVMALAVFAFLPERTGPKERMPYADIRIGDKRLLPFFAFALAFSIVNAIPIQTIAFYFIDRLGYTTETAPGYVSIGLTAGAMASLFAQLVIVQRFRLTPARLMRIAPALMIAGHCLIWLTSDLWPVVAGMLISGLGAGLAIPAATSATSIAVEPHEQGAAIGLANAFGAAGFIFSPIIGFWLYGFAPQAPYYFTTVLAGLLLVYAWKSRAVAGAVPPPEDQPAETGAAPAPYR
ncbi:MFS transporter [Hyphococcus flavus]|uniref:MFS transporter n=1 Tax=Hyphococcus flavus TaxID=1866326 RepID=A0AAE9ZCW1_9PROT|nr:MFS transporter [Hyphococcus flavus]WDI32618.1 MFS transporter [Hyphococcus flavus]